MGKKDFKKGMEAGAKPFEDKFKKQEEAINRVGGEINKKMDNINSKVDSLRKMVNDNFDTVYDYMAATDKKALYDLNTQFDIKKLEPPDKELLVAGLYTLAAMSDNLTEYQQTFVRSVQKYLDVKMPQTSVDLSIAIENVEDLTVQKAIMQTFMEFLFLENENDSFLDDYEELFDFFSVNKKGREAVLDCVHNVYRATGAQGIAEKYGYTPEISDNTETNEAESGDKPPILEKYVLERELTINADEKITIENKDITLNANIICEGTLEFINCKFNYDISQLIGQILLKDTDSSSIVFEKCLFMQTVVSSIADNWFLDEFFISIQKCKSIEFINCTFINCFHFLEAKSGNVFFSNSLVENPLDEFLKAFPSLKSVLILNCEIRFKNLNLLKKLNLVRGSSNKIFVGYSVQNFNIRNSIFISDGSKYKDEYNNNYNFYIISCDNAEIYNCEFINLNCFRISNLASIKNSYFYNLNWESNRVSWSYGNKWQYYYEDESAFLYDINLFGCLFVECSGTLYHNNFRSKKEVEISTCKFINISKKLNKLEHNYAIMKFHAKKENDYSSYSYFSPSIVKDCVFNGINIKNSYLISGRADNDISYKDVVRIQNCSLENYKTNLQNQEIIKKTDVYDAGIFTKKLKEQDIVSVTDCKYSTGTGRIEFDGNREIAPGIIAGLTEEFQCGIPENWLEAFGISESEAEAMRNFTKNVEEKINKKMNNLIETDTANAKAEKQSFYMTAEKVSFSFENDIVAIVTGVIVTGSINCGDKVEVLNGKKAEVIGIKISDITHDSATRNDYVKIYLKGLQEGDIKKDWIIVSSNEEKKIEGKLNTIKVGDKIRINNIGSDNTAQDYYGNSFITDKDKIYHILGTSGNKVIIGEDGKVKCSVDRSTLIFVE